MAKQYELKLHTGRLDSESDESTFHDWTIYEITPSIESDIHITDTPPIPRFFEGNDKLTLGEAKEFTRLLNLIGHWNDLAVTQARTKVEHG